MKEWSVAWRQNDKVMIFSFGYLGRERPNSQDGYDEVCGEIKQSNEHGMATVGSKGKAKAKANSKEAKIKCHQQKDTPSLSHTQSNVRPKMCFVHSWRHIFYL